MELQNRVERLTNTMDQVENNVRTWGQRYMN